MATFSCRVQFLDDRDPFTTSNFPEPTRPPTFSFLDNVPLINQIASIHRLLQAPHRVEDCALQICHFQSGSQGELGSYLELESTLDEQAEELECFTDQRKNTLILRTQLTVRVGAIIEKLSNSSGRELRRALFCLKQIFQDDKDLVHEFVNNDGLSCLITVGTVADPNYQNYILRALGQVMLYVDGMEGVIRHNATIQWLYSLLASKGRLVVKTALKLLLVFVEYTEYNTVQLIRAIDIIDSRRGLHPWTNVMSLLSEKDGGDSELLVYTMTLVNKVISAIPDQDMFYDVTDCLEEQNMEAISRFHMTKQGADLDLLTQFQIYESALKHEDGEDSSDIAQLENLRQVPRKKSESHARRKSKRHEGAQEITVAEYNPDQVLAPDMPVKPTRRRRQEQREAFHGPPPVAEDDPASYRTQVLASEKLPVTNQHNINQNSRTQRRNRQRFFTEEKQELMSVMNRQNKQQEDQPSKSEMLESLIRPNSDFSIPFVQNDRLSKINLPMESLPQSSTFSRVSADQSHLSRSEPGQGGLTSHAEHTLRSSHSDYLDGTQFAIIGHTSNSHKQFYESERSPELPASELPQGMSHVTYDQNMSPVSYLPDSAHAQSNRSRTTLNLPVLNFDNNIPDGNISRLSSDDRSYSSTSQQQYQPHHPHFYHHYHRNDQQYHLLNHHGIPDEFNKDHSFVTDGNNLSSKDSPTDSNRESRFNEFPQTEHDPHMLGARNNNVNDKRSDLRYGSRWQSMNKKGYESEELKSAFLQKTAENDLLTAGQVKSMLSKLKNEDTGVNKEAMRPAGDVSGIIANARDNLNNQKAPKQPSDHSFASELEKKGESDIQWDRIQKRSKRELRIKDMDFSDLKDEDDVDIFSTSVYFDGSDGFAHNGIPPPPPLIGEGPPPPPPIDGGPPPSIPSNSLSSFPATGGSFRSSISSLSLPPPLGSNLKKNKKTLRLHWRALPAENPHPATKGDMIWKHLVPVNLDTVKLEHLFETKTSELKTKDLKQDAGGKKEITVLDAKRSNAINIGLTVLPPPRSIKAAILKMDNAIMNKEGIEKILTTMIPTEEEKAKILEAQMANPDIPLGTAEQFLLTLSSVFELEARLKLWLFKLDYELSEQELAEPLMDLKKGVAELRRNKTFRCILSGVLTIGNFLNGAAVHAFNIEFLQRLPEIKDTVRKHSLIHHLCTLIIEQFPDTTDLYSEIGPIIRCSRVDWDDLAQKLNKMENDCKASWDYLQAIVKHDGSSTDLKGKMSFFLADAAERIMILNIIFKRTLNRYNKMLLFLGFLPNDAREMKVNHFCKVVSEFALEYRTTRDKVIQMQQKKANQRERKKTRGKLIVDMDSFKNKEAAKDDALHTILNNGYTNADETGLRGQRSRRKLESRSMDARSSSSRGSTPDGDMYDTGEDEILEACVRTAATSRSRPQRDRKRSRNQRKSLRRTLKGGLGAEEVQVIETYADHM